MWKLPETYHKFMKSFRDLVFPKKVEKKEPKKETIKVPSADE